MDTKVLRYLYNEILFTKKKQQTAKPSHEKKKTHLKILFLLQVRYTQMRHIRLLAQEDYIVYNFIYKLLEKLISTKQRDSLF